MRSHWAFRRLCDLLSKAGFHVFRFDYSGTGDSAGESGEGGLARWKADIRDAIEELKDMSGTKKVSIVGLRLGSALAAEASAKDLNIKDLVLWDPVVNGKSYIDKLRAMHHDYFPVPQIASVDEDFDGLLGFPFPLEMRASIEQIDLLEILHWEVERIFLIVSEEKSEYLQFKDRLSTAGVQLHYVMIPDAGDWENIKAFDQALLANDIPHFITRALAEKLT
jgi:pimeloyl-ACP methyl ester carboxylesterase